MKGKTLCMIKISAIGLLGSVVLVGLAFASSSYTEYEGSGEFFIRSELSNLEDKVEGNAKDYSGTQYVTDDEVECYGYAVCSYDESHVNEGEVDLQQTITNHNSESFLTMYNTGLHGTGFAYSAIFSSIHGGYSYEYSYANDDTYAYFSQVHMKNDEFDHEVGYGGGTLECGNGSILMENYYSINSPARYSPIELSPDCNEEGCSFVYLYGNATDVLNLNLSFETLVMSWYTTIDLEGLSYYDMFSISNESVEFDFEMVIG